MSGLLDRILARKEQEIEILRAAPLPTAPARRPVALRRPKGGPLNLLAEIKRRSPSAGALSTKLTVAERAITYATAGAALVSVLTDEQFFGGGFTDLLVVRAACPLPLLCKDFIVDETQLDAARAWGADAALLIVRCLDGAALARLVTAAKARQLVPLVEITNEEEAERALSAGAELIGVNARDLDSLSMNPSRAAHVLAALPASVTAIHLSGLASPEHVRAVAQSRADGALIGEALMRLDDPAPLLEAMVRAAARQPL